MPRFQKEPAYFHGQPDRTAIMLMNLGTPDAPTTKAVRRYLKQFLSDRRVVEIPRAIWWLILNGIILPIRSKASAKKYASIWFNGRGGEPAAGSPLLVYSRIQAEGLANCLHQQGVDVEVALAMRYGRPSIPQVLKDLRGRGVTRILALPLYPQYSATTTATGFDCLFAELADLRNQPEIRTVRHYHDEPVYIQALATKIQNYWTEQGRPNFQNGDRLVMSFHGLPKRNLMLGDPYHCECHKTGRLLAEALGLEKNQYQVCFQSRFGKAEWLQPYTSATLTALGKAHTRRVDVCCPGFPADCLETLEEIAMEGKETFLSAGGGDYHYIACLNDDPTWLNGLTALALKHLQGWSTVLDSETEARISRERALAMGATQ